MDASEVMEFFERRAGLIEGVVLSGGEPALQEDLPGFALELKRILSFRERIYCTVVNRRSCALS